MNNKKVEVNCVKGKAYIFTIDASKIPVNEFALKWLNLYNNVREYKNIFFDVRLNSKSDVTVIVEKNNKDSVKEYLISLFGEDTMIDYQCEYIDVVGIEVDAIDIDNDYFPEILPVLEPIGSWILLES